MTKTEKRGQKNPVGFTKRRILLLALDYPDGIKEPDLVEEIRNKCGITELKGIRGHLADLREGRIIDGREKDEKRKEGKQYLLKEAQLGKENTWTPNPDFASFHAIALEFLSNVDLAVPFMRTEYTQKMVKEHIFAMLEKRYDIDMSTNEPTVEDLKYLVLTYPSSLIYLFQLPKIYEKGDKEVFPDMSSYIKGLPQGVYFSAVRSLMPLRGQDSVLLLNTALSLLVFMHLDMYPQWRPLFDDDDIAKLKILYESIDSYEDRPDVQEKIEEIS
jgi:hypothetical protein